ncbi:MAG: ParA family protein [Candidatus Glassbacteria bacterium]
MRISVANLKGGTGKTTTAVNLSACLALEGHKILLVDMDPQADATIYTGFDPLSLGNNLTGVLFHENRIEDIIVSTNTPNLDIAPAAIEMSNADLVLAAVRGREKILAKSLRNIEDNYDYIFIDTPPSMSLLLVNSLMASEQIIIPTIPSYLSIRGLKELTTVLSTIKNRMYHDISVLGILLTFVDSKARAIQDVVERLREKFGIRVFDTVIRRSVGLIECPSFGQTIFEYDNASLGARCYRELSAEIRQKTGDEKLSAKKR